ncbi:rho GTPase-activating protein 35-like [Mytilus galloprovincialis]|uniref:rho GTPase-activating protein 35-like n=1 Tax=Mytilus galloprovincialis TaxID=29158 RepID=UPI003F7B9DFF
MPDGKLHIDGFICCFDVSQSQQRTLEQVDFVIHLLNCALKKNKPVVLVTTKTDEANKRYLKEAEKIVARKEYKNNIPLINTSAHENVNIELAFITLAQLIDKTKTRPNIIPFSEAVKQRKHILDVAMEAYKSLLKLKVIDSKAVWSTTKRKLEKDLDFGHYVDLFGTDSAKRLFRKHIAYLRDEQIKKREQFFLQKLPETINHFLPDLISINDKPWSGCQRYIADHPDYDTYFVELAPGDESWKSKLDFVENYSEIRIPFDLLNSSDAEKCFRNHLKNLQAEYRKSHTNDFDVVPERHFPTSRPPFRTDESINPDLLPFAGTSEDFHKLLSTGTYESFENRVFLCGSCACGKSSLASILIGSPIPLNWKSTDGLVIHFGRNGINLGTYEMVPLKEGGRGHNVLTKVVIGKPNREQTSLCQSVDTDQDQPIELPSPGTKNLESNLQAIETDINDVSEVNESIEACLRDSQEILDSKTTISEMKKVSSISLPKTKKIEAYAVHDDILKEVKSGQYTIKIAPSDLVDFGGQRSYDMTHQLFVQHGGTFVVMFDGSKDFREPLAEYPTGDVSNELIGI